MVGVELGTTVVGLGAVGTAPVEFLVFLVFLGVRMGDEVGGDVGTIDATVSEFLVVLDFLRERC